MLATLPAGGTAGTIDVIVVTETFHGCCQLDTVAGVPTPADQFTYFSPLTATQAIPSVTLTQNQPATSFTPVTASGGSGSLTYALSGGALPSGLSFSTTTGQISGTPGTTLATTTFEVTATDTYGDTASASFSLTVNSAVTATQAIASTALTQNHAATSFTPVTGEGGTGALSYSVSPSLPSGLSMASATGAITGTPALTSAATSYTVTVTDANNATATASFSLTVNGPVVATQAVASMTLTQNHAATSFTPVTGGGGTGALSYSVLPALPAGLSMAPATGAITGTPSVALAATSYTVTVTDTNGAAATASFALIVNSAVTLLATASSATQVGQFYRQTNVASTGTAPYTYSLSAGTLPAGTTLNASTGTVFGTSTTAGAFSYTIEATDSGSPAQTATQTSSGTIALGAQ